MIYSGTAKAEARARHRKELREKGIVIGCHHVVGAKQRNGDQRQGKCLVCGQKAMDCKCDDRSEWLKKRQG